MNRKLRTFTTDPYGETAGLLLCAPWNDNAGKREGGTGAPERGVDSVTARAFAAAKLSMRGANYSDTERLEFAAYAVARVMEDAASWQPDTVHGSAADVLKYVRRMEVRTDVLNSAAERVPAELATFTRLSGMAANYRRGIDRDRARDAEHAATQAASEDFTPRMGAAELAPVSPRAAQLAAMEALASIGLPRLGRAFPLAYAAVRDGNAELCAAELGAPNAGAFRVRLNAARKCIPSAKRYSFAEHLNATGLLDAGGRSVKGTHAAKLDGPSKALRTRDGATHPAPPVFPVDARTDRRLIRKRATAPEWTLSLHPATAARLRRAAELRKARAIETDPAERASMDAERGTDYRKVSA